MIYLPKPRGHSTMGSPEVSDEPRGVARCPWGFINYDERAPLAGVDAEGDGERPDLPLNLAASRKSLSDNWHSHALYILSILNNE